MADVFIEHMVKRKPDAALWIRRVTLWLTMGLVVLLALALLPLLPQTAFVVLPVAFMILWALSTLHKRLNVEYEYIFTNGELDFDLIYGRTRRKRVLSVDCRNFDLFAPLKEEYRSEFESQTIQKRLEYSSSPKSDQRCFAVFSGKDGVRTLVVFEPSDRMKDAMKVYLRNKYRE